MSTAKIFVYKGHIAAIVDPAGKFLNDPSAPGQLGAIIQSSEVEITKEAKQAFKENVKREGGSFSSIMLTKHSDNSGSSLGIMGVGYVYIGESVPIGRDCDVNVIDDFKESEIETPEDYKTFIDNEF